MQRSIKGHLDKLSVFKDFALSLAKLSKCEQRGVASLLVTEDLSQVLSIGINGGAKGSVQCLCSLPGKETCIHAEQNMLAKNKHDATGMTVIVTLSPCIQCAAAMINAGIRRVYYVDTWKDTTGIELLKRSGVVIEQL